MNPTPFELSLESELNVEWQRFSNEWLFKWHGMTYEGGKTDVEDYRGGRIHYSGIRFGDQQRQIFWEAFGRYLNQKTHEVFRRWDEDTREYSTRTRLASLDGVERILGRFVAALINGAVDTDRALRGKGNPNSVELYDRNRPEAGTYAEIARIAEAHRRLLREALEKEMPVAVPKVPVIKRVEKFFSDYRGIISIVALITTIFGIGLGYFLKH